MGLELYTYFRSSAAYRVRIALNLKRLSYRPQFVHLAKGMQRQPKYREINPQGLVPTLVDRGTPFTQSLAIIEYLNDTYPDPPLLPRRRDERAYVRALAQIIACDIHPLNNLRVLRYLAEVLGQDEPARNAWIRYWIEEGFGAFEEQLARHGGSSRFCFGDTPTLADICLVPQVFNARRFGCDLNGFPRIRAIDENCLALTAFRDAAPEQQADAE
ncbi:maleylacetoacetate isomerase [Methylocaldum gracile]|jgi:maleylacetoacetate isomerase|uniref:maleylacetoacetate isomerase n=1 Tax=unclassified Methylocaldum TaxID=2622260 RepID=UPI0010DAE242